MTHSILIKNAQIVNEGMAIEGDLRIEEIIGTPVQTTLKRVDEQGFANLNAENLMFFEDAAQRIKLALERMSFVKGYWFEVEHRESLHAHNAVVIDQNILKG